MADQGPKGLSRILKATGYSFQGLKAAYIHEAAFRQEVWLAIILLPLGFWLGQSGVEKGLLVSVIFLVLLMELMNSAIEAVVDRIGSEHHELAGRAKDIGSAAVFISLLAVLTIWGIILIPRFLPTI